MHSFTTERLLIRPLIAEDENFICQQYTDAEMMRYVSKPMTSEEARKVFQRTIKSNAGSKKLVLTWGIIEKKSQKIIGFQALSWQKATQTPKASPANIKQVESGLMIASKAQGMGYATEAIGALIEYAFNYKSIERINVFYANKNLNSKQLFDKLKFTYDAKLQDSSTENGYQYIDKHHWHQKYICQVNM